MKKSGVVKTEEQSKNNRSKWTLLIVLGSVALVLGIAAIIFAVYMNKILNKPETMFRFETTTSIPEKTPMKPAFDIPVTEPEDGYEAAETPTSTAVPENKAEATEPDGRKGILNILLMGIDAYEDGRTTSGTMPHTDSMMVIAVNFDRETADLITLPRDTFTTIPGHSGFYKLNGVFNVGLGGKFKTTGKSDDLKDGFELTCRTAEQWLGGVSIPYYYGVDFQAVIDIVDAIGGIDYDVDQAFRSMNGRSYGVGMQHLDGNAVLGYLRIRQSADGLDSSRTARQRRMMVAIFKKLKSEGKLSQIPDLISAANSGVYTNASLGQTAALVNFAANLPADRIRTRAMSGDIGTIEVYWRFAYVDQQNRIDLIKEVYDIDTEPVGICTRQYERWLNDIGFVTIKRLHQIEKVLTQVQQKKDAGETFSEEQITYYIACYQDYIALHNAYEKESSELADLYARTTWREKKENQSNWTSEEQRLDDELKQKEAEIKNRLLNLSDNAKASLTKLADSIRYRNISWSIKDRWYQDPDINEVYVNFG